LCFQSTVPALSDLDAGIDDGEVIGGEAHVEIERNGTCGVGGQIDE
jgi:hypothetical protein